jgi:transcriptional regulator with XRE-family HTH domain
MFNLYNKLVELCSLKGVSGSRMCVELGISKSTMTDLKNGRIKSVSAANAQKIASYFNVTVDELYGKEKSPDVEGMTPREEKYDEIISLLQALPEEKVTEAIRYLRYLAEN